MDGIIEDYKEDIAQKELTNRRPRGGAKADPRELLGPAERRSYTSPRNERGFRYKISYNEFYSKGLEEQYEVFYHLVEAMNDTQLREFWGLSMHHVRQLRKRYGVVRNRDGTVKKKDRALSDSRIKLPLPKPVTTLKVREIKIMKTDGTHLRVNHNSVSGAVAAEKLLRLADFLEKEAQYTLTLEIKETDWINLEEEGLK